MTRAAVVRRTGLGPSALYRVMREGRFPAPFKVRRSVGRSAVQCSQRETQAWTTAFPRSPVYVCADNRLPSTSAGVSRDRQRSSAFGRESR